MNKWCRTLILFLFIILSVIEIDGKFRRMKKKSMVNKMLHGPTKDGLEVKLIAINL